MYLSVRRIMIRWVTVYIDIAARCVAFSPWLTAARFRNSSQSTWLVSHGFVAPAFNIDSFIVKRIDPSIWMPLKLDRITRTTCTYVYTYVLRTVETAIDIIRSLLSRPSCWSLRKFVNDLRHVNCTPFCSLFRFASRASSPCIPRYRTTIDCSEFKCIQYTVRNQPKSNQF